MGKKVFQLTAGFVLAYLFVKWIPTKETDTFTDLILIFVLNPLEFFAAALAFGGGVIIYGGILKSLDSMLKMKKLQLEAGFTVFFLLLSAGYLLQSAFIQTTVFFSTSVIYGMIFLRH